MRTILIGLTLLGLAGCVNATTRYQDGKGNFVQCSGVAFGIISSIVTEIEYQHCKTLYHDLGWKEQPT